MELRKTNWTDHELLNLCNPANHKIEYDGFEYWWFSKANDIWVKQFINAFETENKALEYLYFNLSVWNKELFGRISRRIGTEISKGSKANIRRDLYNNIKSVKKEFPYLTQKRIAEHFKVSVSTIKRALR